MFSPTRRMSLALCSWSCATADAQVSRSEKSKNFISANSTLRKSCKLTQTGVSDNVGGVKHVATTLPHALEQERHFALIGEVLNPTKARFLISIQVGKLSSTHASLRSQARS